MKTARIKNLKQEFSVGKIVCVGRNYAEHAKELGNEVPEKPVLFLKPSSSLIYSGNKTTINREDNLCFRQDSSFNITVELLDFYLLAIL